jgi:DNA-binding beta-propeller fold protein YncE
MPMRGFCQVQNGRSEASSNRRQGASVPTRSRTLAIAPLVSLALLAPANPAVAGGFPQLSLVGAAPVAPGPSAVAVNPATHTVYVASGNNTNGPNVFGSTVSVIDTRRCRAQIVARCAGPWPTITVGHEPSALAVAPATDTLYVTNADDNTVSVIDGASCNALVSAGCAQTPATIQVGAQPDGIGADAANHTVYVANFRDGSVSLIDSATCNGHDHDGCPPGAAPTVAVGDSAVDVDFNPRTHTVYVGTLSGLTAFDERTCNATRQSQCALNGQARIPPCDAGAFSWCGPFTLGVDAARNTIYETDGTTTVWVFDGRACSANNLSACATATPGAVTPFPQPGFEASMSVAVDADLHTVYVSYQKDDALIVIDEDRCDGSHLAGCE